MFWASKHKLMIHDQIMTQNNNEGTPVTKWHIKKIYYKREKLKSLISHNLLDCVDFLIACIKELKFLQTTFLWVVSMPFILLIKILNEQKRTGSN